MTLAVVTNTDELAYSLTSHWLHNGSQKNTLLHSASWEIGESYAIHHGKWLNYLSKHLFHYSNNSQFYNFDIDLIQGTAKQSSSQQTRCNNFTAAKLDNGFKFNMFIFWNLWSLSRCAFGALTLLTGHWKEHPVCKNWLMRCWCGYLSGARCRLYAYGPADATASQNPIITHLIWIQAGFTLLVPAYPGFLGKEAVKRGE